MIIFNTALDQFFIYFDVKSIWIKFGMEAAYIKVLGMATKAISRSIGPIKVNQGFSMSISVPYFSGLDPNIYSGFKSEIHFIFQFQFYFSAIADCWFPTRLSSQTQILKGLFGIKKQTKTSRTEVS